MNQQGFDVFDFRAGGNHLQCLPKPFLAASNKNLSFKVGIHLPCLADRSGTTLRPGPGQSRPVCTQVRSAASNMFLTYDRQ